MRIIGAAFAVVTKIFEELGKNVVKYNSWFLITPIFLTAFLSTGLQKIRFGVSEDYYIPSGGVVDTIKSRIKTLFPLDVSYEFDPVRLIELCFYTTVTIQASDGGSVLRKSVFNDVIYLDKIIRNLTVNDENERRYEDICAKREGKCYENKVLLLNNDIEKIENRILLLKYPVEENFADHGILSLGGVTVTEDGYIISAKAITLFYFLDNTDQWKEDTARKWEKLFLDTIENLEFINIIVDKDISISREQATFDLIFASIKYFPPSIFLMILFTLLSSLSPDFLRSKPWIGIISSVATGMSLGSGFGLLSYIGITVTSSAILVPFLVLGIGMDDTFIMLSAWIKTDKRKSIEDKIVETYKRTGVSITITSFTNVASFAVAYIFVDIEILKPFCIIMAACLVFDYIYQITFIGAFLVIFGRAEESRLHSVFFIPLDDYSSTERRTFLKEIFCYVNPNSPAIVNKMSSFSIVNFWMAYSKLMTKNIIKIFIIILYFAYIGIIIWGFNNLFLEATLNFNLIEGSSRSNYYMIQNKYYHRYQYRLQLFIDQKLDYADPHVQQKVEEMMQNLESDPLTAHSDLTGSWLRIYLKFLSDKRNKFFLSGFNLTDSDDFLYILRHYFLKVPLFKQFKHDVAFDKNFTNIVCSRFFLQTNITRNDNHFYSQLTDFKKKLNKFSYSLIIYHPLLYYFDLIDSIPKMFRQTFCIVISVVFLISAILLPSVVSTLSVLFSIFSISAGILSVMFLWDIGLNLNSTGIFIIVIGLCVDYAAHVSCAYADTKENDPNSRLINAVTLTAMPIIQGAITTILAFVLCVFVGARDLIDGVKLVTVACFIAAVHGILFLPVIMSLFDSFSEAIFACQFHLKKNKFELGIGKNEQTENGTVNTALKSVTNLNVT